MKEVKQSLRITEKRVRVASHTVLRICTYPLLGAILYA